MFAERQLYITTRTKFVRSVLSRPTIFDFVAAGCMPSSVMRSVPPRGSGWVRSLLIVNFRLPIASIPNRQLTIGNWQLALVRTHPLPRGGTDLMSKASLFKPLDSLVTSNTEREVISSLVYNSLIQF
jgi:hypothetical protein